jgi:hypothetical protein
MALTYKQIAIEELKMDIIKFLTSVNENNFWSKHGDMANLVSSYKDKLSKAEVQELLVEIGKTNPNEYQEEVLVEVSGRLSGYCSSQRYIIEW